MEERITQSIRKNAKEKENNIKSHAYLISQLLLYCHPIHDLLMNLQEVDESV